MLQMVAARGLKMEIIRGDSTGGWIRLVTISKSTLLISNEVIQILRYSRGGFVRGFRWYCIRNCKTNISFD